jgi:hypothetical protein
MSSALPYAEDELATLIALLPPAPADWVAAAKELPQIERGLEQILALAEADVEFRQALLEDLEKALETAGYEAQPGLVRGVKARLMAEDDVAG